MTRKMLMALAASGSAAMLLGAFSFQYIGGLLPCAMCLWQRWPHAAAVLLGVVGMALPHAIVAWVGALSAAVTAGLGAYHFGVEQKWWEGPTSCTGSGDALTGLTGNDLLSLDGPTGVILCDEIVWELFGITMAGYNFLISGVLALIWVAAALRKN